MHGAVTGRGHSGGLSSKESVGRTATAGTWGHRLMATSLEHACGGGIAVAQWQAAHCSGSRLQWHMHQRIPRDGLTYGPYDYLNLNQNQICIGVDSFQKLTSKF
jgi:hypothetical protein